MRSELHQYAEVDGYFRRKILSISGIYGLSILAYLYLVDFKFGSVLTVLAIAAFTLGYCLFLMWRMRVFSKKLIDFVFVNIIWYITGIMLIISCMDLVRAAGTIRAFESFIDLSLIRGVLLNNTENYRSAVGKICGMAFVPFAATSALMFRIFGGRIKLLISLLVVFSFSILLGGRGQIVMFSFMLIPSFIGKFNWKILLIGAFLMTYSLGYIYEVRSANKSSETGVESIFLYLASPWYGAATYFDDDLNYNKSFFSYKDDFSDALENTSYYINGIFGNVYGGLANTVNTFGFFGAFLYYLFFSFFAIKIGRACISSAFCLLYLEHIMFGYFCFLIFHDLFLFYKSYAVSILIIPVLYFFDSNKFKRLKRIT